MTTSLRWGIVGTGMIANIFAESLGRTARGVKAAVASRDPARAEAFRAKHGFARAHGSYRALFADPEVDAVYVSTPHTAHVADTVAALKAGKHVLCEKPMGVTTAECRRMAAAAAAADRTLLEAFMYRVHPQTLRLREVIARGAIGRVRLIRSSFTYNLGTGGGYNVRTDLGLRGGGLYDVGCYCVDFSRMIAGEEPDLVAGAGVLDPVSGVDSAYAGVLGFPGGAVAHFDVGIHVAGTAGAEIIGTAGRIVVPNPWKPGAHLASFTVFADGRPPEEVLIQGGGDIYALEADHLADVVAGAAAPLMSADNAAGTARVLDALWGQLHGEVAPAKAKARKAKPAARPRKAAAKPMAARRAARG